MKTLIVYTSQQIPVVLETPPLGQGGEGVVYKTKSHQTKEELVAKIYHPKERTATREPKINHLIAHAPKLTDNSSAIFPEEPVYDQKGNFIGFLMKQTVNQVDITSLCSLTPSAKLNSLWHHKYHRYTSMGMQSRIRVCYNIAKAFEQLHKTDKFVFVDIKPENIKLTYEGEVSLIDIDSIQVAEEERLLFAAQKLTHEYSPAEIKQIDFRQQYVPESWDRFSLAVVFYKILFGLHPYTGSCAPPFDKFVTNEQKIAKGLFVHGEQRKHFDVIPTPHQNFWLIPVKLQELFFRAFEKGYEIPVNRPSMQEWMQILDDLPAFALEPAHTPQDWHRALEHTVNTPDKIGSLAKSNSRWQTLRSKVSKDAMVVSLVGMISLFGAGLIFSLANGMFSSVKNIAIGKDAVKMGTFHEGLAWKRQHTGSYVYTDKWNHQAFNNIFEEAYDFSAGLAKVKRNGKYGFINLQGIPVIPLEYDLIEGETIPKHPKQLLKVRRFGKFGLINQNGDEVIPTVYDNLWYNAKTGVVQLQKGKLFGLYDHEGVELTPIRFQSRKQMLEKTRELLKIYHTIK